MMNLPTNSLELANNLNSHRSTASSYWQFFKNQSLWRTYWWFLVYFSSFLVSSMLFSRGPSRPVLWHLFMTWVSISSNVFFFFSFLVEVQVLPWWFRCRKLKRHVFHPMLELDPWVGKISWRRKWQSTPVFLPVESCGQSPWGQKDWTWPSNIHTQ